MDNRFVFFVDTFLLLSFYPFMLEFLFMFVALVLDTQS